MLHVSAHGGASSGGKIRIFDVRVQCENYVSLQRNTVCCSVRLPMLWNAKLLLGKVALFINPSVQNNRSCIIIG
jgi:hypothetical protein